MSTDTPGAPQPSGADEPDRSATPSTEQESAQPTARTEGEPDVERTADQDAAHPAAQDTQHLTVQPTQQLASPPAPGHGHGQAPTQPDRSAQQPRYGQMASGSPYYAQQPASPEHPQYSQHPQHPQQGQPYAQHPQHPQQGQPYAQSSAGGQGVPGDPYSYHQAPAPGGADGATTKAPRQRSVWVSVASAAVIAAVLASLGTAAVTGAFNPGDESSLANVGTSRQADEAPVKSSTSSNPDWEKVTTAVAPSVVAIQVQSQAGGAEGSGVVYDDEGHVLTNNHVVSGAQDDTVQVTLSDGRLYEATIVGTDPTTDLAVVQLQDPPDDLQPASFGDADDTVVGDPVLAVGNPLGLANTATTGIVSALDRPVSASGEDGSTQVVTNAIQIDAAINPGNSGGPLFNSQGQVIGITSSIATLSGGMGGESQGGSIGLGFAIPVNLADNIADQLIADGTAEHAFLGVTMQDATASADGVTRRGAQVVEVSSGSPSADAGLQAGDVIVAIDDDSVNGAESLTAYVREKSADQKVTLTYVRDGKTQTVDVTLAVKEESATDQGGQGDQGQGDQGPGDQGQDGQDGQDGQGQDDGSGSTSPDNLPDWLQDLLEGNN